MVAYYENYDRLIYASEVRRILNELKPSTLYIHVIELYMYVPQVNTNG